MFDKIKNIFNTNEDGRDGFKKWSKRILEISEFISKNNRLPESNKNDKNEYNLYQSYCANKRKFYAKKLSPKQQRYLEQHNIIFENNISDRWKNKVLEIEDFIKSNGKNPKTHYAFKKSITDEDIYQNKLYHALARIRKAKEKGKLSDTQLEFLEQHNIILENNISNSDRWKNKVLEISDFIITNERYPKSRSKDISEEKLYHALARIRRAKEKGKLSDAQTDLLKKCSIIFENNAQLISLDTQDMEDITNLIKQNQILKASQLYLKCSYDSGIKDYKFIENSFEVLVEETLNV